MTVRRTYGGGWHPDARDNYIRRIKKMGFIELKAEMIDLKYSLATLDTTQQEFKVAETRTEAAYKLSAILCYLRKLL